MTPGFVFGVAELLEVAAVALGLAGVADLAAMVDELVREGDPTILRDDLHQLLLDFFGGVALWRGRDGARCERHVCRPLRLRLCRNRRLKLRWQSCGLRREW